MSDIGGAPIVQPAPGTPVQKPQPAWYRWASIFTGVAFLVVAIARFLPHGVESCDDSDVRSNLTSLVESSLHVKVTGVTDIKTISHNDKAAVCTANVAASDGSHAVMSYRLDRADGKTTIQVDFK